MSDTHHPGAAAAAPDSRRWLALFILLIANFMNLIDLYFLSNWLPTLIRDAGYPTDTAVLVATALQVGGVIVSKGWRLLSSSTVGSPEPLRIHGVRLGWGLVPHTWQYGPSMHILWRTGWI